MPQSRAEELPKLDGSDIDIACDSESLVSEAVLVGLRLSVFVRSWSMMIVLALVESLMESNGSSIWHSSEGNSCCCDEAASSSLTSEASSLIPLRPRDLSFSTGHVVCADRSTWGSIAICSWTWLSLGVGISTIKWVQIEKIDKIQKTGENGLLKRKALMMNKNEHVLDPTSLNLENVPLVSLVWRFVSYAGKYPN